jgi:hypothetical protein
MASLLYVALSLSRSWRSGDVEGCMMGGDGRRKEKMMMMIMNGGK